MPMKELASGLRFPEGPIAMPDGSILLVEIERGTLSRVTPNGTVEVVAETGGGPNGAAIGPDGACYICNNGGFEWHDMGGMRLPGHQAHDYETGRIERVDLSTGKVERLYDSCNGNRLRGPNDIVFDRNGGFYFSDLGKGREREVDRGGLYYAKADGSMIKELAYGLWMPNGVGLSPDEKTVYVAETITGRVWAFDLSAPGEVKGQAGFLTSGARLVTGLPGFQLLDSMAVDSEGFVCVATLINGGITRISPDGMVVVHYPTGDPLTTNVCFGGPDMRTAYVTLSGKGTLVSMDWPVPGLPLNYLNT